MVAHFLADLARSALRFAAVALALVAIGAALALALGAAPPPRPAWLPDPRLTPGDTVALPVGAICDRGYAGRARHVTEATKREVFRRYGLDWADRARYEVDHLIPLACGGANTLANLWPQPWGGPLGARQKDRLEVRLRSRLCSGSIDLAAAHAAFRGDWSRAYRAEGLDAPPPAAAFPSGPVADPDPEGFPPDDDDDEAPR